MQPGYTKPKITDAGWWFSDERISQGEVADMLGWSSQTLRNRIRPKLVSGQITRYRDKGRIFYRRSEIENWLDTDPEMQPQIETRP